MAESEKSKAKTKNKEMVKQGGGAGAGAVYGLGFIGAVIYYFSNADTFWLYILGFLKALVWPAYLVYELFDFLGV